VDYHLNTHLTEEVQMARRLFKPTITDKITQQYDQVCSLWLGRLVAKAQCSPSQLRGFWDDYITNAIDVWDGGTEAEPTTAEIKKHFVAWLKTIERRKPTLAGTPLVENIDWLGERLGFDQLERDICAVIMLLQANGSFQNAMSQLSISCTDMRAAQILASMTGHDLVPISRTLSRAGALAQSGLVRFEHDINDFERKFRVADSMPNILLTRHEPPDQLLTHFFRPASPAKLKEDDFAHLDSDYRLLHKYLAQALVTGEVGVNILIHGKPGTGKSEFARLLAASVDAVLHEVSCADEDGDAQKGEARLASYLLCQRILGPVGDGLVLFDEIEDVFPSDMDGLMALFGQKRRSSGSSKAWISRILETNPVPSIWISNSIEQIDPAYLRRFDFILEIPTPPEAVRHSIAKKYFGKTQASGEWIAHLAKWDEATPAQLEKAARVASMVSPAACSDIEQIAERVLRASAQALGQSPLPTRKAQAAYSLNYVNTSRSPEQIIAGLRRVRRGSFCFFGPPGTGKTALAGHIAETMGKPVMIKRASDLLSKWVGDSEKNIAAMFRAAETGKAVLILDEADSLLADRRDAGHSWEVTQVNEMLSQMENFQGIFVCTTNLLDRLDSASLRRFDFKVRFDFLRPDQRIALMQTCWPTLPAPLPALSCRQLAALDQLTPGDYAVVARQWALTGMEPEATEIIEALSEECRVKGSVSKPIGFLL
jgi:SpoVK/Ycf46/Vps4 family AAA+-type ATPase